MQRYSTSPSCRSTEPRPRNSVQISSVATRFVGMKVPCEERSVTRRVSSSLGSMIRCMRETSRRPLPSTTLHTASRPMMFLPSVSSCATPAWSTITIGWELRKVNTCLERRNSNSASDAGRNVDRLAFRQPDVGRFRGLERRVERNRIKNTGFLEEVLGVVERRGQVGRRCIRIAIARHAAGFAHFDLVGLFDDVLARAQVLHVLDHRNAAQLVVIFVLLVESLEDRAPVVVVGEHLDIHGADEFADLAGLFDRTRQNIDEAFFDGFDAFRFALQLFRREHDQIRQLAGRNVGSAAEREFELGEGIEGDLFAVDDEGQGAAE